MNYVAKVTEIRSQKNNVFKKPIKNEEGEMTHQSGFDTTETFFVTAQGEKVNVVIKGLSEQESKSFEKGKDISVNVVTE